MKKYIFMTIITLFIIVAILYIWLLYFYKPIDVHINSISCECFKAFRVEKLNDGTLVIDGQFIIDDSFESLVAEDSCPYLILNMDISNKSLFCTYKKIRFKMLSNDNGKVISKNIDDLWADSFILPRGKIITRDAISMVLNPVNFRDIDLSRVKFVVTAEVFGKEIEISDVIDCSSYKGDIDWNMK